MSKLKNMFVAFGALSLVMVLVGAMTPAKTQGQGGNQNPLNVNVVDHYPQPFQRQLKLALSNQPTCIDIPPDKGLIIELVIARTSPDANPLAHYILAMSTTAGGETVSHKITLQRQPTGTDRALLSVTQPLRAYADPGTQVCFGPSEFEFGPFSPNISLSGQLVNAP